MLQVKNLVKKYGSLEVLNGISFEIKKGTVYGFLGQNGAGKTTTMNIITGLIGYNSGEIYLDGKRFDKNKRELLRKVGYLPQNPVFYNYMNAYEYLNFIGQLSEMKAKDIKNRSEEVLEIVKLKEAAKRKIGGYSGGMKQRMGLAVSIFHTPEILVLDEPTSALDPEGRMEIMELIRELKLQGTTVFLSTHILNDIERACDEVSIIHKGEIIVSEQLETLKMKYIEPIYDIEFENDSKTAGEILKDIPWISKINTEGTRVSIYVKDIRAAKENLLKEIAKLNNPVLSLSIRKSDLEDIFMKLIRKSGDDNGNL